MRSIDSQRSAEGRVSCNHLISNKREWNNSFIKNNQKYCWIFLIFALLEQPEDNLMVTISRAPLSQSNPWKGAIREATSFSNKTARFRCESWGRSVLLAGFANEKFANIAFRFLQSKNSVFRETRKTPFHSNCSFID